MTLLPLPLCRSDYERVLELSLGCLPARVNLSLLLLEIELAWEELTNLTGYETFWQTNSYFINCAPPLPSSDTVGSYEDASPPTANFRDAETWPSDASHGSTRGDGSDYEGRIEIISSAMLWWNMENAQQLYQEHWGERERGMVSIHIVFVRTSHIRRLSEFEWTIVSSSFSLFSSVHLLT